MPIQHSEALDDPAAWVRQESFGGGANSFQRAVRLAEGQWARGTNVLVDVNQRIQTRPGLAALGAPAASAPVDGMSWFDAPSVQQLLAFANGAVRLWNGSSWTAAPSGYTPTAGEPVLAAQGIDKLIVVDGVQNAHSWDGSAWVDLDTGSGHPPASARVVLWHTARAFYAGMVAEPDALYVSDLLDPGTVNHASWVTRVGSGDGDPITALVALETNALAVFKQNSIWLVDANPTASSAAEWGMRKLLGGIGAVGRRAAVRYGPDVFFLARDGIRSLRRMAATEGAYETTTPLSQPVQDIIDRINWAHADKTTAAAFDQFVFFSLPLDTATEPNATLVFNGRLGAWLGLWTWPMLAAAQTAFGGIRQLVWGHPAGHVYRWLWDADKLLSSTYEDAGAAIETAFTSGAYDWGDQVATKETWHAEARFVESRANARIDLILDGEAVTGWDFATTVAQNALPVNLPFNLATRVPRRWRKGLGKRKFRELQFRISSAAEKLSLESISVSAFADPYRL